MVTTMADLAKPCVGETVAEKRPAMMSSFSAEKASLIAQEMGAELTGGVGSCPDFATAGVDPGVWRTPSTEQEA